MYNLKVTFIPIGSFAVPANHRVKLEKKKKSETKDKYLGFARKLKKKQETRK